MQPAASTISLQPAATPERRRVSQIATVAALASVASGDNETGRRQAMRPFPPDPDAIKAARQQFFGEGRLPEVPLSLYVGRSWQRCLQWVDKRQVQCMR